jgi:hypothetical protein
MNLAPESASRVVVGGVDEVSTRLREALQDPGGRMRVRAPRSAGAHRPEAEETRSSVAPRTR